MEAAAIPPKSHFKVDEVCSILGIRPYVLRFWESEFPHVRPITSSTGHKLYQRHDMKTLFRIKHLLFQEKLSVEQAKGLLDQKEISGISDQIDESPMSTVKHPSKLIKRTLNDSEIQKLILCKAKLQGLVGMISSFKKGVSSWQDSL